MTAPRSRKNPPRATAVARAALGCLLAVAPLACSSGPPPAERLVAGGTVAGADPGASDEGPPAAPGARAGDDDGPGAASVGTEGACGLLRPADVARATGDRIDAATVVPGGCRWLAGDRAVVELEIASAGEGDVGALLATRRAERAGARAGSPGIGERDGSFADPDGSGVTWAQNGAVYALELPGGTPPGAAGVEAAARLARAVSTRLG